MKPFAVAGAFAMLTAFGGATSDAAMLYGDARNLGNGNVRVFVETAANGKPKAIGITLSKGALEGLPPKRNTTSRCWDLDKNGRINDHGECEGDYELKLDLPHQWSGRREMPFRWIGLNWNPEGHPPAAWAPPHFDFHFYMVSKAAIKGIRVGPCGIFMNCEDFKRAIREMPPKYVHREHISVKAAVGEMGNHLIDSKTPELAKVPKKFTHTWIFGAYDADIIFYEPMITRAFLQSNPNLCKNIKQPRAWQISGYYPLGYCTKFDPYSGEHTVSLEGLTFRKAE